MENVEYLGFLIEVVSPETGTYEYSVFDMTGKDKPEFSLFETDDVEFVSYEAAVSDAKSWIRDFLFNDEDRAKEHIEKLYATKKDLSGSLSTVTTGSAAKKLTVDVFNRPDCPGWARYAVVNANGKVILFSDEPSVWDDDRWIAAYSSRVRTLDDVPFDASDWKNSLIERHVFPKLTADMFDRSYCPDWANYAAVDAAGRVVLFSDVPRPRDDGWVVTWYSTSVQATMLDDVRFDASDWQNSLIERHAPQKLTADVFNRSDCPEWANYVAVDSNNKAHWFKVKPEKTETGRWWSPLGDFDRIPGKFDAGDWQNSLIERPAKLPEWCKVGGYGYDNDIGYFKIVEIIDCGCNLKVEWVKKKVQGTILGRFLEYKKQARLRPYNDDELRGLVGKTINTATCSLLVIAYSSLKHAIKINELWRTADQLFSGDGTVSGYTVDGKPCCVFEHLNDAGEWVE